MKTVLVLLITAISLCNSAACQDNKVEENQIQNSMDANKYATQITFTVNSIAFKVNLFDSPTVESFKALLPLTIYMNDLNANEKHVNLPKNLPTNSSNPGTINNGDIRLYGANTLVLFYKTFLTSYNYTKIGKINDPEGLAKALGSTTVEVTFKLK